MSAALARAIVNDPSGPEPSEVVGTRSRDATGSGGRESALSPAHRHLDDVIDALERAKAEVPNSVESLVFVRAEVKVLKRRIENIRKAIGDTSVAP